jgi:cellulose synthase/poly-beta-1,6-N-acetylglucosamine synthase-like glycosyltransferase
MGNPEQRSDEAAVGGDAAEGGHALSVIAPRTLKVSYRARTQRVETAPAPRARVSAGAVTIVVPLYNESHRFVHYAEPLLEFTLSHTPGSELVFVDDGSSDRTKELVGDFCETAGTGERVRSVRCSHRGKGSALRTGLLRTGARCQPTCVDPEIR